MEGRSQKRFRYVSAITLLTLLVLSLILSLNVRRVEATYYESIRITHNGMVDPPDAPIERTGNVYTLTDNIYTDQTFGPLLTVERDDIIVDGANKVLQGPYIFPPNVPALNEGIHISGRKNVTIRNTTILLFSYGVFVSASSNTSIERNWILKNRECGIKLDSSSYNKISENTLDEFNGLIVSQSSFNNISDNKIISNYRTNGRGIQLRDSSNFNILSYNVMSDSKYAMVLVGSSNNSIFSNEITDSQNGIRLLTFSGFNDISRNRITASEFGILLDLSSDNRLTENLIANHSYGLMLSYSSNNSIIHNDFVNNSRQVHTMGECRSSFDCSYPSGGNYWSDYLGSDDTGGPNQNLAGSDGIGDTPYSIDGHNTDRYPLMSTWTLATNPTSKPFNTTSLVDPTPGYHDTSLYMIGSVSVAIILLESNATIDNNTEDWTDYEIASVLNEIQVALDWWAAENRGANVSFTTEAYTRVPTSYEPITRSSGDLHLSIHEAMNYLGYIREDYQWIIAIQDFLNDLREKYGTDWAFLIFVVDSSDDDGYFEDGASAAASSGGPFLYMTYDNGNRGIENMDLVCAHEIGHIFYATDEYLFGLMKAAGVEPTYYGYLDIPDIPDSHCLMDELVWELSGAPYIGTWGQVGWRDSDGDGIQDIVDTIPKVLLSYEEMGRMLNFSGTAIVATYPNIGKIGEARDVTINRIQSVKYRIDNGTWLEAAISPTRVNKLVKYPDQYETRETYAIINYTFLTSELEPGNHTIEVGATNQWGNVGFLNQTIELLELRTDLNQDGTVNILDLSVVAFAYQSKPGDDNWNSTADLNNDEIINILDLSTVAMDYGKAV